MKRQQRRAAGKPRVARDVMTTPVISVSEEDDVWSVAWTLVKYRITGAPVVDAQGDMVGVVSLTDLAVYLWNQATDEASFYTAVQRADDGRRLPLPVKNLMTRKVITASEDATLTFLAKTMLRHNIHRILITRGRKLVGIVSTMDLLRAWSMP